MDGFDERLQIDTPENVAFGYEVAGIGSRFLAALIDTIFIVILQVVVFLIMAFAIVGTDLDEFDISTVSPWSLAILSFIAFAFLWGYYIFFEVLWNGQSPGKRWTKLRVIRTDGTPISVVESVIRNLVRLIDFLPFYYALGVFTMFINSQSRRLGDLAAGTLVVWETEKNVTLESLQPVVASKSSYRPTMEGIGPLPVEKLTNQDHQLIENYLRRRNSLSNHLPLAQNILKTLLTKMDLPPGPISPYEADRILAEIARTDLNALRESMDRHTE